MDDRLRDAAYTAVGLGVLGLQRFQVLRRQVEKQVDPQLRDAATRLQRLVAATDEQVNPVLDRFEEELPEATRELVHAARAAATEARDAVLARARRPEGPRGRGAEGQDEPGEGARSS